MDGGFATLKDVTTIERRGVTVYAPQRPPKTKTSERTAGGPHPGDTPEVARWQERMDTEEAKEIYKGRAAAVECVNAHARCHKPTQLLVRGVDKVRSVLLLVTITHNLLRWLALSGEDHFKKRRSERRGEKRRPRSASSAPVCPAATPGVLGQAASMTVYPNLSPRIVERFSGSFWVTFLLSQVGPLTIGTCGFTITKNQKGEGRRAPWTETPF